MILIKYVITQSDTQKFDTRLAEQTRCGYYVRPFVHFQRVREDAVDYNH